MADFYVKYGSEGANLLGNFKFGSVNIKLHRTIHELYVISRNRSIVYETKDLDRAIAQFFNSIEFENDNLLTF